MENLYWFETDWFLVKIYVNLSSAYRLSLNRHRDWNVKILLNALSVTAPNKKRHQSNVWNVPNELSKKQQDKKTKKQNKQKKEKEKVKEKDRKNERKKWEEKIKEIKRNKK